MEKKLAFIGAGNMGSAVRNAVMQGVSPGQIMVSDPMGAKIPAAKALRVTSCNVEATQWADIIFLCVKPQVGAAVLAEIAPVLKEAHDKGRPKLLCSILAGVTLSSLAEMVGITNYPIARLMPNMPVAVGQGLILLACSGVSAPEKQELLTLLAPCGAVEELAEESFDFATVLAACSPAFFADFFGALAQSGQGHLPPEKALEMTLLAAQGTAAMLLEQPDTEALKRMVMSPGGSTAKGVEALAAAGLAEIVNNAAQAAYNRNKELGEMGKK